MLRRLSRVDVIHSPFVRPFGYGSSKGALVSRAAVSTGRFRKRVHGPLPTTRTSDTHNSNMGTVHKQRALAAKELRINPHELQERSWRSIVASLKACLELEQSTAKDSPRHQRDAGKVLRFELHQYMPLLEDFRESATVEDHVTFLAVVAASGFLDPADDKHQITAAEPQPIFTNPLQLSGLNTRIASIAHFSISSVLRQDSTLDTASMSRREIAAQLKMRETLRRAVETSAWLRQAFEADVAKQLSQGHVLPALVAPLFDSQVAGLGDAAPHLTV